MKKKKAKRSKVTRPDMKRAAIVIVVMLAAAALLAYVMPRDPKPVSATRTTPSSSAPPVFAMPPCAAPPIEALPARKPLHHSSIDDSGVTRRLNLEQLRLLHRWEREA